MLEASRKRRLLRSRAGLILSPETAPNVTVYGSDYHFQDQWLDVVGCYLISRHTVVSVSRSVLWLKYGIGVLYLSHAMLILAEFIVCSTRGVCMHPS